MDLHEPSLPEIHKSIGATLKSLKEHHAEIISLSVQPSIIKNFLDDVLKPSCELTKTSHITGLQSFQKLLTTHQVLLPEASKNITIRKTNSETAIFPPLPPLKPQEFVRPRPPSVTPVVRYPAISPRLTQSPRGSKNRIRPTSVPNQSSSVGNAIDILRQRQQRLKEFSEEFEACNNKFQEMFTNFTQRVLVPLQTFCKHTLSRERQKKKKIAKEDMNWEKKLPKDLNQNEFFLMETLNSIRMLLWPNSNNTTKIQLSPNNLLYECLEPNECEKYQILGIHLDVLEKFTIVLNCASLWLKRDEIYTENAKCGLLRAHRRFAKTQRMWQEARRTQRQLSSEWNKKAFEIARVERRLETLKSDMEALREDLIKLKDERQTTEIKLLNATEGIDWMRTDHRELRKRINSSCKKLESKERICHLVNSRIRSFKADQEAVREKLLISMEYAKSLQEKMMKLFNDREAWRRRYEEKVDPKILKTQLELAGLRIPSFVVKEKTFVLRTRIENLQEAISIVYERLKLSETHWSLLCHHLVWPKQFLSSLSSANPRIRRRAFSDRDSSSSSGSSQSDSKQEELMSIGKMVSPPGSPATQHIINYVKSHCQGDDDEKCLFMLKLWLDKNGSNANLEDLVKAFQQVRLSEAAHATSALT